MSELKAIRSEEIYDIIEYEDCYRTDDLYYLKSEADKVIAKLEEKLDTTEKLLNKALDCISNDKNHMMNLARKCNHSNYKRCLAMASFCFTKSLFLRYVLADRIQNGENFLSANDWRINLYEQWCERWKKLAEKFKEAK